MSYDRDLHHRHSIRLKDYDYSSVGAYFVTICAWQRTCLFGEVVDGEMVLNDSGGIVSDEWVKTATVRINVELDQFVVMPNHLHAILVISDYVGAKPVARPKAPDNTATNTSADLQCQATQRRATHRVAPTGPGAGTIGAIMAQFKSMATKRINIIRDTPGGPVWQRNYYERVIRDEHELSRAREYIINNPMKWDLDRENPVNVRIENGGN